MRAEGKGQKALRQYILLRTVSNGWSWVVVVKRIEGSGYAAFTPASLPYPHVTSPLGTTIFGTSMESARYSSVVSRTT
jgi:hypothetical protein